MSPNPWKQIDDALARHQQQLEQTKDAARLLGFAWVRCADSGVWSARRSSRYDGGAAELHERTAEELVKAMQRECKHHKRSRPEREAAR